MKLQTRNTMRILTAIILSVFCSHLLQAQNTAEIDTISAKKSKIKASLELNIGKDDEDHQAQKDADTTRIRMGKKEIIIIESGDNKRVDIKKAKDDRDWDADEKNDNSTFDGHWAGFELGVNGFTNKNYNMYGGLDFMELDQAKSWEVNINFWEKNICLQKNRNNIGLVTGLGLSYNNYKFDNPYTIDKIDGRIEPIPIEEDGLKKSKLTVSYLTIPLMLECQIPVNHHSDKLFIAGGVEGGLNIGSHTKIKWNDEKEKDRGDFGINDFKYAVIGRVGMNNICLFASYNLNPLFKDGKGPELTPFTIGITLIDF